MWNGFYFNKISSTWSLLILGLCIFESYKTFWFPLVHLIIWPRINKIFMFFFSYIFVQICWSLIGDFCWKFSCLIYFSFVMATKTVAIWSTAVTYYNYSSIFLSLSWISHMNWNHTFIIKLAIFLCYCSPSTPRRDPPVTSPYVICMLSSKQEMRILKLIVILI